MGLRAHAKLNLALAVAPPEPADGLRPGWHRVASWVHAIELHDEVELCGADTANDIRWASGDAVNWQPGDDLAVRALGLVDAPHSVRVTKRIPTGGGLGGGSSDAGTVLRLAGAEQQLDSDQIVALGSDIPFFVDDEAGDGPPRPAIVRGFGGLVSRTPRLDRGVVLILPGIHAPTPEVYRAFDEDPGTAAAFGDRAKRIAALASHPAIVDSDELFNDLEPAARRAVPGLGETIDAARDASERLGLGPVHMTGSGSTLFLLTDSGQQYERAENLGRLLGERPGCRVIATRLV
ncbi:MAG: hypothetical protein AAGB51_05510 [Planctomycetota bacterium]